MCHHKAPHRPWEPDPTNTKTSSRAQTIPEPDNLFDHYEGRARAVAAVTMKVGEDMNKTDLKQPIPARICSGDALRKWAYQIFIKDYLRCIQQRGRQRGPAARLPRRRETRRTTPS